MAKTLALHLAGLGIAEISRQLSCSRRTVYSDLATIGDERIRIEEIIEDAGVDAHDVWIQLSRIFDGDRSEILNEDGTVKRMQDWPLIFRQCLNVVVEDVSQRSHDGETKDKDGGWDKSGKRVRILGIDPQYLKAIELVMKHKGVDAMATQRQEVDINLTATITAKLQSALRRQETIDVTPENVEDR